MTTSITIAQFLATTTEEIARRMALGETIAVRHGKTLCFLLVQPPQAASPGSTPVPRNAEASPPHAAQRRRDPGKPAAH